MFRSVIINRETMRFIVQEHAGVDARKCTLWRTPTGDGNDLVGLPRQQQHAIKVEARTAISSGHHGTVQQQPLQHVLIGID